MLNCICKIFQVFFEMLRDYISPLGNTCILLLTIYTFYRTYISKKVKFFGYSVSNSVLEGFSIGINIQNWSLSTIAVSKIELVVDEKVKITINKFDDPLILEPLKSVKISSEQMSDSPSELDNLFNSELKLLTHCFNGKVIISKIERHFKPRKTKEYEQLTVFTKTYDGKIVTPNMKYKVYIYENDILQESFIILHGGVMEKCLGGFNVIPEECLKSKKNLKEFLFKYIDRNKYTIEIFDFELDF